MSKKIILILLIFSFNYGFTQLNQQSKKITQKFFSDLNELENITPALQKKKGFTNYKELLEYIDNKIVQYPEIISKKYIGESQKGYKIPMVYLSNKNNNKSKIKVWMQGGLHGNEPSSTESLLYLIHLILENNEYKYLLDNIDLAILPMANIDGYLKNSRYAANGLDLNRDLSLIHI